MKESCNAEGRRERVYSDAKVSSLVVFISLYIQLRGIELEAAGHRQPVLFSALSGAAVS
jgi:hypothetical protein